MRERLEKLIPGMTRASDSMVRVGALLLLLLLIAGFSLILREWLRTPGSPEPEVPVVEPVSTERPEAAQMNSAAQMTSTAQITSATPAPPATSVPSTTPAPTATVTSSPLPSVPATPEPTPDGPATVMAVAGPTREHAIVSPNGRWRAQVVIYPCSEIPGSTDVLAYEQLNVMEAEGGEATTAPAAEQLISCGGLGASGLEGLFWSANSRYFYYTTAREGVPDGCGYWRRPLLRVDAETGENEWLGPGELSPDGAKVAAWQGGQLVIWDAGGEEVGRAEAAMPDGGPGQIAWSPEGDALVYVQAPSYCPLERSTVVHLTIAEMAPAVLLEAEAPAIGEVAWMDAGRLRLVDGKGEVWIYDLADGALRPAP